MPILLSLIFQIIQINKGSQITFTLTATNNGLIMLLVTVNSILPNGYTYISHNASVGTYNKNTGDGYWQLAKDNNVILNITALVTCHPVT